MYIHMNGYNTYYGKTATDLVSEVNHRKNQQRKALSKPPERNIGSD